jgi:hypothetical protein
VAESDFLVSQGKSEFRWIWAWRDVHRVDHVGEQNRDLLVLRVGIGVVDW